MTQESDLLRDSLFHPDDDAPRLAYADFLHARGDPRGRFMRLQLRAVAAERNGDPDALYAPWLDEADALRARHGSAWIADLCPPCTRAGFVRGMVEHVALSAQDFLDHAQTLYARAPIRHVDLTEAHGLAPALSASPLLAPIRSLQFDRCGLDDDDIVMLAASPHLGELQWLELMRNAIGLQGARALAAASAHLPQLRYVGFFGNQADPTEEFSFDQGVVVDGRLPAAGRALEAEFGPIAWLHPEVRSSRDLPPPRHGSPP